MKVPRHFDHQSQSAGRALLTIEEHSVCDFIPLWPVYGHVQVHRRQGNRGIFLELLPRMFPADRSACSRIWLFRKRRRARNAHGSNHGYRDS